MHAEDNAGSPRAPRSDAARIAARAIEALAQHVAVCDVSGSVVLANAAWRGFARTQPEGECFRPAVGEPCRGVRLQSPDGPVWMGEQEIVDVIAGRVPEFSLRYPVSTTLGTRWFAMRVTPLALSEGPGALVVHEDVSECADLEEELTHHALHDRLTALPNRALLLDRLNMAVKRAKRRGAADYALLYLDIDRFNVVNESLGHVSGDMLLMALAHRLLGVTKEMDTLSRFGSDEFALLLEDVEDPGAVSEVAARILECVRQPFSLKRRSVVVAMSIGIVLGSTDYENAGQVLRDAETVMHRVRESGGGRYEIFSEAMRVSAGKRLQLEMDLRKALDAGEIGVHYQPIVSLADGRLRGLEALARWRHPELGMVPPMEFIPVAEETGQIVSLGHFILRRACTKLAELQRRYPGVEALTMNVNISGAQFARPEFADEVREVIETTGIRPGSLKLELTESVIMADARKAVDSIRVLRDLGVHVVIDDFGTGYSSLSYLQRFPVSCLKVDRSFVLTMADTKGNREIVKTIIKMAHSLGLEVVAEGVEQAEQLEILAGLSCESGQGFLFSKPLNEQDLDVLLHERLGPA